MKFAALAISPVLAKATVGRRVGSQGGAGRPSIVQLSDSVGVVADNTWQRRRESPRSKSSGMKARMRASAPRAFLR